MNPILNDAHVPDYFVAQFPGGGQRGYATVKLLEWFESKTGLPTHQLFPYVTTGSVGIPIAAALYLPHPDHPNAARMSARQLATLFPTIASRLPPPARFTNKNSREPFADAIRPFIGEATLKDLLGTIFFSSHKIGGLADSNVVHGKMVSPQTGQESYAGDADTKILDIALAGTSLPSLFPAYNDHIDMAFSDISSRALFKIKNLFPYDAKGAFVRVGNFRSHVEKSRTYLNSGGYVTQAANSSINDAVSDNTYSQTIGLAQDMFQEMVFNLEYEIDKDYVDPPEIQANITSSAQFERIERMSEKFIIDNVKMLTYLAKSLKTAALKRMEEHPETAFGILPEIQEFPLTEIPSLPAPRASTTQAFSVAVGRLGRGLGYTVLRSLNGALQAAFDFAHSPVVQAKKQEALVRWDRRLTRWTDILLPRPSFDRKEGAQSAPLPSITQNRELR